MGCCLVPGRFPALERMSFYRVIPSQHLLPAQLRTVTLQEIRPPYNSELGSEVHHSPLTLSMGPAHVGCSEHSLISTSGKYAVALCTLHFSMRHCSQ